MPALTITLRVHTAEDDPVTAQAAAIAIAEWATAYVDLDGGHCPWEIEPIT